MALDCSEPIIMELVRTIAAKSLVIDSYVEVKRGQQSCVEHNHANYGSHHQPYHGGEGDLLTEKPRFRGFAK